MNASQLKAICRWLITICLAASLVKATMTLSSGSVVEQPILPAAPQEGHGN